MLNWLARDDGKVTSSRSMLSVLSLECLAWLLGAIGHTDSALDVWAQAAQAGSARAQLDLGVCSYGEGTASPMYCMHRQCTGTNELRRTSGAADAQRSGEDVEVTCFPC